MARQENENMVDTSPTEDLTFRLATLTDIETIELLDSFSSSPTRDIHRDVEKYFGSVDPSTHEHTVIFLAESQGFVVGKAELMLPPSQAHNQTGYIKRVVTHPEHRKHGLGRSLMNYIIEFARKQTGLTGLDLYVWEHNTPALHLYESLGFSIQHRELYLRLPL